MGAINVGGGHAPWVVAGWAFRGYLSQVLVEVQDDPPLARSLEEALAVDGLHFPHLSPAIVRGLTPPMMRVADEIVSGVRLVRANGRVLDDESQYQFRRAVAELRATLS